MRRAVVFCLAVILGGSVLAQRNDWRPKDFEPLTELPWKTGREPMAQVIERIYRETDRDIRYPVLTAYLQDVVPVTDLGRAFDMSMAFEGTQTPDELVTLLLQVWAQRDPKSAWARTKELFRVFAFDGSWLDYDSWERRIDIFDLRDAQRSAYWLTRKEALVAFAIGCDSSKLPETERVKLLQEFAATWFQRFTSWPRPYRWPQYLEPDADNLGLLWAAFYDESESINEKLLSTGSRAARAGCEIIWRRWLAKHPERAGEVIKSIESTKSPHEEWAGRITHEPPGISTELLLIWRKVDPAGLKAWAGAPLSGRHAEAMVTARCIVIGEVPPKVRDKWLAEMLSGESAENHLLRLAGWEPQLAMQSAAMVKGDDLDLAELLDACACGPWGGLPQNACHSGLGYLMAHGVEHLPKQLRSIMAERWTDTTFLELWGDIDIGEAARYGLRVMLEDKVLPREELIEMYEGRQGSSDDAINDRTFCALRVWAVVRPDEMRAWIKSVEGDDMRKALTWTLEHPWGTGEPENR